MRFFRLSSALLIAAACAKADAPATTSTTPNEPVPPEALAAIDTATLMRHIRVLSHDSLLGRQPGSLGEDKTIAYLESEMKAIGFAPGNTDGTYIQKVPLVGITVKNSPSLTFTKGGTTKTLKWRDDYVVWTKHVAPSAALEKSEVVFVGYGTEAPEFKWDDYKMAGRLVQFNAAVGDILAAGAEALVLEAMKMQIGRAHV